MSTPILLLTSLAKGKLHITIVTNKRSLKTPDVHQCKAMAQPTSRPTTGSCSNHSTSWSSNGTKFNQTIANCRQMITQCRLTIAKDKTVCRALRPSSSLATSTNHSQPQPQSLNSKTLVSLRLTQSKTEATL